VRQTKLIIQQLVSFGGFQWRQVLALYIFNQCQFKSFLVVGLTDDRRNGLQAGELGSPQAAFTGD
jgi:hypothetical protein